MAQITYGSITLVDLTDVGQLSVYPTSNMPLSIIYDPDQNSYTPNWGDTNLTLSPSIYYNTTQLTSTTSGLTITWTRKEGTAAATALTSGETQQSNGDLKVTANKFTPNSSMITYIITADYIEPETQRTLTAQGQITFSLVKLASSAKTCIISGENIYKYDKDGTLVSNNTITLTATINNVSISAWQYKTSNGTWANYPNLTDSQLKAKTINIQSTDAVFVSDVATIKVITDDANVYDIHSVTKLRDGAPGDKAVSAVLTNENQRIPCDASGNPISGAFDQATSQIIIYDGGVDDTSNWNITTTGTNVTFTQTGDTVTVTNLTNATGSISFTCQKTGYGNIIKTFSLVKVTAGQNGTSPTIHSLDCSALAINKTTPTTGAAAYSPTSITIKAYEQTGSATKTLYQGRFWIKAGSTTVYKSSSDETTGTYTITSTNMATAFSNANYMTVELYQSGGTATLLDSQTIVFTSDGAKGEQGEEGEAGADAINIVMGNYADVIPCSSSNVSQMSNQIDIPFVAYEGLTQVPCTVSAPKLLGVTASVTNSTASVVGHVKYSVNGVSVTASSGTVPLTFTVTTASGTTKQIVQNYTWTRSTAATNGVNAKLFELYTVGGDVFTSRESQDITIIGRLMDGSQDVTSSATNWTWAKWQDGAYSTLSTTTGKYTVNGSRLTVNNSAVEGFASFRATCEYSSVTYTAYYSLIDRLDPIQATAFCSLGEQIVNGQGYGAFYVIVTDTGTGQELDVLKSDRFLTAAPSNPSTGDFYYHLNTTNKTVVLKKYTGSAWADAGTADLPKGTYTWTFRDSSGNATTFNGSAQTSGKVIYVDGTLITKKIIADVKVEI